MANALALGFFGTHIGFRRKCIEIHACGKYRTAGGDDNDTRQRVAVNVAHDLGQILPEGWDHAVALFRTIQTDMGNIVLDVEVKGLELLRIGLLIHRSLQGMYFSCEAEYRGRC